MNDLPEWFAPKRYGYGAGLPIAWQGWAVLACFIAILVATGLVLGEEPGLAATIIFPAIALFIAICAKTTRGGWHWRWGGD